jgi:hypothetical protein
MQGQDHPRNAAYQRFCKLLLLNLGMGLWEPPAKERLTFVLDVKSPKHS